MGLLVVYFRGKSPQQELLQYPLGHLAEKNTTGDNVLLKNWYLSRVKQLKVPPTVKIVVPLKVLLQAAPSYLYGSTPRAAGFVRHKSLNSENFYI